MKIFILIIFCLNNLIVNAQYSKGNRFILTGKVSNRDTGYIILGYNNIFGKIIRDTSILQNGQFQFKGEIAEPVFASIRGYRKIIDYENVNEIEIFIEPAVQNIQLIEDNFKTAKLTGSETNNEFDTLNIIFNAISLKYKYLHRQIGIANDLYKIAATIKEKELALQKANEFIKQLEPENDEYMHAVISFVKTHPDSYVSSAFLYNQIKKISIDSTKAIFQSLTQRIQKSINGVLIANIFNQLNQNLVGSIPIDFIAKDINDNQISLMNFKRKFLYIDFWASWCEPCREQIPHLKKLFNKYNSKGLEILTISIDKDFKSWKKALTDEKIENFHNILVTKEIEKNYENATNPIPSGMLIGQNGKVVWKSGTEENLEAALKRIIIN